MNRNLRLFSILLVMGVGLVVVRSLGPVFASGKDKASLGYADGQAPATESPAAAKSEDVKALKTVKPELRVEDRVLRLTGTIIADQKSEVASTANGIVQEVRVESGSLVEKGDVLVVVDPEDTKKTLAEGRAAVAEIRAALGWEDDKKPFDVNQQPGVCAARATLNLAKANFDRYSSLLSEGAVSRSIYDQARTQYETAQQQHQQALHQARQMYQSLQTARARLDILEKMVADTTIRAPFGGWVAEKYVSEGERVSTNPMGAGAKVVSLVRIDPLRLVLTVPQQHAALVREGQQVTFTVEAFRDKTFTGQVKYISPSLQSNSRSLSVEAVVANPDRTLRPGFFASAQLVLPEKMERLAIPAKAIRKANDAATVRVVRGEQVVEKVVEVDETRDGAALIKSGLGADDQVVVPAEPAATPGEGRS